MPRTMLRAFMTTAITVVVLAMTTLPAFAASSGTKPTADADPFLIGSLEQLGTAAIVGIVVAIIIWVMMPARSETAEDEHH